MSRHRNKKQNSFNCYIQNQTDNSADIYFTAILSGMTGINGGEMMINAHLT